MESLDNACFDFWTLKHGRSLSVASAKEFRFVFVTSSMQRIYFFPFLFLFLFSHVYGCYDQCHNKEIGKKTEYLRGNLYGKKPR